ncbi:MAG: EexN family lipoprotein [Steroidobacteraceae bacterium]
MRFRPGVQRVRRCLGLVVTLTSTVGCAPAPDRASHTVDEYRNDAPLREQEFARCANDPGSRNSLPDCINAREAERLEGVGSLRTLAPLELPSSPAHPESSAQDSKSRN